MTPLLTAPPELHELLHDRLANHDVDIAEAPESAWIEPGSVTRLQIRRATINALQSVLDGDRETNLLVLDGVLDDETAARLEDSEIGYIDAAGRIWIPGWPRGQMLQTRRTPGRRLAPSRIRAAQIIADHPERRWTERELADAAGTSAPTAHHLMSALERDGLLDRRGEKRGTRRRVNDVGALRRWLAENAKPGRVTRLACYIPEPRTGDIDGHVVVITGAAAAEHAGLPVLTRVARTLFRVASPKGASLEDVPSLLGGFRTNSGANTVLIDDKDRLGTTDPWQRDGELLAPPSRIMLDLYLESRQPVDLFLDLWGDRDLMALSAEDEA